MTARAQTGQPESNIRELIVRSIRQMMVARGELEAATGGRNGKSDAWLESQRKRHERERTEKRAAVTVARLSHCSCFVVSWFRGIRRLARCEPQRVSFASSCLRGLLFSGEEWSNKPSRTRTSPRIESAPRSSIV